MIVATGANARQLGLESERTLQGRGVSYCAVCDAAFFRDREVIVVGGGDSAMEEAIFLTKFATEVTIVHRRDEFRASQIMINRARANEKIDFLTNAVVEEVLGATTARSPASACATSRPATTHELPADGLFVAIGHDPNTKLFVGQLDMDEAGYLLTKPRLDRDERPGRLRRRRRRRPRLPAGDHGRRHRAGWPRSTPSAGSPSARATRRSR